MSDTDEHLVREAEFNPDVRKYWLLSGVWILLATIAGIPLIIFWWIFGLYITQRYLDRMQCLLTERSLIVRKGIFVRVEKTVPLDKITDLGMVQGPLMRYFNIEKLTVETAGQSAQGALISLYGIRDAVDFRNTVLKQRDRFRLESGGADQGVQRTEENGTFEVLVAIRDSLSRVEETLARTPDSYSGRE